MKKMSNMSDNGEVTKDFMGLGETSSRETEAVIVGIERSSCNGAAASLGGLENNMIEKGGRRGGGEGTARAAATTKPLEELAATDIQQLSREDCWRLILEAGTCISGSFLSQTCACRKKLLEPKLLDDQFLTLTTRTSGALKYGGLAIDLSKVQLLDGLWLVVFSRCAGMQWPSCDTAFRLQSQQPGLLTKASKNAGTRLEQQEGLFLLPVMAADQVVNKAQEGSSMEAIQQVQNQIANKTSRMLANRALDELARTPPRPPPQSASILSCAVPSSHVTPMSSKRETSNWTQQQTTGAVVAAAAALEPPMPSLPFTASVQDTSSRQRRFWETNPSTEQTAQLTIFYAGTVNVFHDVTAEKANLIMLLAANGASLTSVLAKFLSSQVGSMAAPSILNATTASSSVQTSPANPPPASVLPTTSIAAAAPEVAPLLASAQAQQQHFSLLPKLPVPVNVKESLSFVRASVLVPSAEGQSIIGSQKTQSQQQQQQAVLPELPLITADMKHERSSTPSLANAHESTQGNNAIPCGKQGNPSQQELPEGSISSTPPATSLNTLIRSSICYTQELPHARKNSLARFFDMRQRQKRARITSQNALTSKKLVDCSLLPSDSPLSFPKSDEHAPVLSLELSQPSSPTTTSQVINGKDAAAAISERAPLERQRVETAAANDEALPMETETIAVVSN